MTYRKRNSPAKHGELISYGRGCRCDLCRKANSEYMKERRKVLGKAYIRNINLKQAHGIDLDEYNKRLTAQGGVCAACKKPETGRNQFGVLPLAVDHCHVTEVRRGLLCMRCNRALGLLGDSVENIKSLLEYRSNV